MIAKKQESSAAQEREELLWAALPVFAEALFNNYLNNPACLYYFLTVPYLS